MSQRTRILTQIVGFRGWKVAEHRWESKEGRTIEAVAGYDVPAHARLVLVLERRWSPRCAKCLAIGGICHEELAARRWADLPACGHPVIVEYSPSGCAASAATPVRSSFRPGPTGTATDPAVAASPGARCVLDAAGSRLDQVRLSWHTVRRAELCAIERWERTMLQPALTMVGVDEK